MTSRMNTELACMAIEIPRVAGHPNREPFHGVLTLIDAPSDKPPAGARGHRVLLTRAAAEAALPSLLGMALDYAPSLDRHDARRKVGVITRAEIVGRSRAPGHCRGSSRPRARTTGRAARCFECQGRQDCGGGRRKARAGNGRDIG